MNVQDLLAFINGEVAAMPTATVQAMLPVLAAAEKELEKDLATWIAKLPDGAQRFTAQQYRAALVQIRHSLDQIATVEPALYKGMVNGSHTAGNLATAHLAQEVQTFSGMFEHTIRPIPFKVASIIAQGDKLLIPRFRTSAHRYVGQVATDIKNQLALGVVRGETVDQLVRRLQRHGGPKGLVSLKGVLGEPGAVAEHIAEGLFRRHKAWAERLVRTELVNAYNVQADLGLQELADGDPEFKKKWNAAIDARVCPTCRALDGVVVDVDKNFPGAGAYPPLHPNCRCAVVAWHKEWGGAHKEAPGEGKIVTPAKPPENMPEVISRPGGGGEFKLPEPPAPPAPPAPPPPAPPPAPLPVKAPKPPKVTPTEALKAQVTDLFGGLDGVPTLGKAVGKLETWMTEGGGLSPMASGKSAAEALFGSHGADWKAQLEALVKAKAKIAAAEAKAAAKAAALATAKAEKEAAKVTAKAAQEATKAAVKAEKEAAKAAAKATAQAAKAAQAHQAALAKEVVKLDPWLGKYYHTPAEILAEASSYVKEKAEKKIQEKAAMAAAKKAMANNKN